VSALAVVQGKVDRLIYEVLDDLPALEVPFGAGVQRVDARRRCGRSVAGRDAG